MQNINKNIIWFEELGMQDVAIVGGKNASLGEMISNLHNSGIVVPSGFATTANAYKHFLQQNNFCRCRCTSCTNNQTFCFFLR